MNTPKNSQRKIIQWLVLTLTLSNLIFTTSAFAATLVDTPMEALLDEAAGSDGAGYDTDVNPDTALPKFIGMIVRTFLSLVGVIFICYIIYGGFLWLTSGGNEDRITKAKSIIKNGIIGLIVIFSAAAIYSFVALSSSSGTISNNP